MNGYISIIKYYPDNNRDEGFGIGIILISEGIALHLVRISKERLKRINSAFGIKKSVLIESSIDEISSKFYNKSKLDYLSVYENGNLRYTKPQIIDSDNLTAKFEDLYFKLIADYFEENAANHSVNKEKMEDDIFENIDTPNSSAYEKFELRDGIPLDYVREKLIESIKLIHHTYGFVRDNIKDDIQLINPVELNKYSPKTDGLLFPLFAAFRYSLTSLLALQNMLGIVNNQKIFDKLLAFNQEDFILWLERIVSEGSLNG